MGEIRQKRSNEQQEIWHTRHRICDLSGLEKINSIAYLEVK